MILAGAITAAERLTAVAAGWYGPTPTLCWSLRRIVPAYTGPAVRVRRGSDGAEANIAFTDSGDLDTAALAAHCGASTGRVVRWYNQGSAGTAGDLVQTATAAQPTIYTGGATPTIGTARRPAVRPAGGWMLLSNPALVRVFPLTVALVAQVGFGTTVEPILVGVSPQGRFVHWRIECASTRRFRLRWTTSLGTIREMIGDTEELPVGDPFRCSFRVATATDVTGLVGVISHRRFAGRRRDLIIWDGWADDTDHIETRVLGHGNGTVGSWSGTVAELVLWGGVQLSDSDLDAFEDSQVAYYRTS